MKRKTLNSFSSNTGWKWIRNSIIDGRSQWNCAFSLLWLWFFRKYFLVSFNCLPSEAICWRKIGRKHQSKLFVDKAKVQCSSLEFQVDSASLCCLVVEKNAWRFSLVDQSIGCILNFIHFENVIGIFYLTQYQAIKVFKRLPTDFALSFDIDYSHLQLFDWLNDQPSQNLNY